MTCVSCAKRAQVDWYMRDSLLLINATNIIITIVIMTMVKASICLYNIRIITYSLVYLASESSNLYPTPQTV